MPRYEISLADNAWTGSGCLRYADVLA